MKAAAMHLIRRIAPLAATLAALAASPASRALDRVLRAGYYLVPNWHLAYHRIAYRDIFGRPDRLPRYFAAQDWVMRTWWALPARASGDTK